MTQLAMQGPSEADIRVMAGVLTRRHGAAAAEVAAHFAAEHVALGDRLRAGAWDRVAALLAGGGTERTVS